jgi:hypothetical protein
MGENTDRGQEKRREKGGKVQVRIFRCVGNSGKLYRLLEKKYMTDETEKWQMSPVVLVEEEFVER